MTLHSRIEKLERAAGKGRPDHFVTYILRRGDDEAAVRDAALTEYRATHAISAGDGFGFICQRIVAPDDPIEWISRP
jgi:hypothetical protein